MCGHTEIDGLTFSLGLASIDEVFENSITQAAFLMRGARFRPKRVSRNDTRRSLRICSLGELVDKYHTHKAKILHDKVFALLGMSSEDISGANLEPNYNVTWSTLMMNLVKFLIGSHAFVRTWDKSQVAVINCKGIVLGQVFPIGHKQNDKQQINIKSDFVQRGNITWTIPSPVNSIEDGDVLCFLQETRKPTIIRPCNNYFAIIMIAAVPIEQTELMECFEVRKAFRSDFLLIWDWENLGTLLDPYDHRFLNQVNNWQSDGKEIRVKEPMNSAIRAWNYAQVLRHLSTGDKEATEKEKQATETFRSIVQAKHLHSSECQCNLIPLAWAISRRYDAVVRLLLRKSDIDLESRDCLSNEMFPMFYTPLSYAAFYGHEAVVKLLLEAGAEVESKDYYDVTPLQVAVRNGHVAIVKLLLEAGAKVDSKNRFGETPLQVAAEHGNEAIVKLLSSRLSTSSTLSTSIA
jgi:ankyrin repeat protein